MGYSQTLGEFIVKSHSLDLPEDLVSWIKLLTLDTIGCGLLAASLQWVDRLLATLRATEGQGPATVWGHSTHLSAANAAMVNGTAVHGFELDDVGADGHFGAVTTTSALALAETGIPLSGLDLIRATVAGIEVQTRVSNCVGRVAHVTCGFHGPGLFGTFGAASTSCYVLALDAERSSHALANAAQFTSYGVNFKMWACRAPIHPALEAVKSLQSARRVDYRSIERVEVALPEGDFKAVGHSYLPSTPTAAQLNLQYCLAVMLMDGEVFLNQFSEERIADPETLAMVARIHVAYDERSAETFTDATTVTITLKSGQRLTATGSRRDANHDPVGKDDVVAKFHRATEGTLSHAAQARLTELCLGLEHVQDARELLEPMQEVRRPGT